MNKYTHFIINGIKNVSIIPTLEVEKPKEKIEPVDFTSYLNLDEEKSEENVEVKEEKPVPKNKKKSNKSKK